MPKKKIAPKDPEDKFYTSKDVVKDCLIALIPFCREIDLFIEPSAGNGAFSSRLPDKKIALDINPDSPEIIKQDWFEFSIPADRKICVVGNPPFGSRNALSKKFITHAVASDSVQVVAFILPDVFKKITLQKVFPDDFSLAFQIGIPYNGFMLNGSPYHVPCCFQVWVRNFDGIDLRQKKTVDFCRDFDIMGRKNDPEVFVFGAAPNRIIKADEVKPNNRGYYLKSKIDPSVLVERFRNIDWKKHGNSSVNGGVFWMLKSEIINVYNSHYGGTKDDPEQPVKEDL